MLDPQNQLIVQRLREFRQQRDLTQAEMAELLGTAQSNISAIEAERIKISGPSLQRLFKQIPELNPDWITGNSSQMYRKESVVNEEGYIDFEVVKPETRSFFEQVKSYWRNTEKKPKPLKKIESSGSESTNVTGMNTLLSEMAISNAITRQALEQNQQQMKQNQYIMERVMLISETMVNNNNRLIGLLETNKKEPSQPDASVLNPENTLKIEPQKNAQLSNGAA